MSRDIQGLRASNTEDSWGFQAPFSTLLFQFNRIDERPCRSLHSLLRHYFQVQFCIQYSPLRSYCVYDLMHPFSSACVCHLPFFLCLCKTKKVPFLHTNTYIDPVWPRSACSREALRPADKRLQATYFQMSYLIVQFPPCGRPWCVFDVKPSGTSKLSWCIDEH